MRDECGEVMALKAKLLGLLLHFTSEGRTAGQECISPSVLCQTLPPQRGGCLASHMEYSVPVAQHTLAFPLDQKYLMHRSHFLLL